MKMADRKKLLKDLMEKQKQQTMPLNSRIQHPLASYDKSNKLTCVVCKIVIHSESVWDIHLRTKLHIAAVVDLKAKHQKKLDQQLMPPPSLPLKKIGTPYQPNSAVSSPNQLPKDFFSSQSSSLSSPSPSLQRLPDDFFSASLAPTSDQLSERSPKPEGLFSGYSDSDSSPEDRGETIDSAEEEEQEQVEVVRVQRKSGLTLDQIRQIQLELEQEESLLSHAEQESKESRGRNTLQTQLPSGFFDSSTGHSISEPHTIETQLNAFEKEIQEMHRPRSREDGEQSEGEKEEEDEDEDEVDANAESDERASGSARLQSLDNEREEKDEEAQLERERMLMSFQLAKKRRPTEIEAPKTLLKKLKKNSSSGKRARDQLSSSSGDEGDDEDLLFDSWRSRGL